MVKHIKENHGYDLTEERKDLEDFVLSQKIMPSMRAMMTAGVALERDHTAGYNCSYLPVDDPKAFDEAMHILMCGSGVGFSVERQYVNQLSEIPDNMFQSDTVIKVKDSKEGWAKGFRQLIALLYTGEIPEWDLSKLRPAGAKLKTFGGRSSGPEPLDDLFKFVVKVFRNAKGRKLTSLEAHDIMCKIGETVVVGGVRTFGHDLLVESLRRQNAQR
jgi:ribonucleoside-triphosphate reductase